jgi:hypothetical protein
MIFAATATVTANSVDELVRTLSDIVHSANQSASTRGWEAQMMVAILVCMLLYFAVDKWFTFKRETRLGNRISALEDFAHGKLLDVVQASGVVSEKVMGIIGTLSKALNDRACLLDPDVQNMFVNRVGDRVAERVANQFRREDQDIRREERGISRESREVSREERNIVREDRERKDA